MQALKLETSSTDKELEALTATWKMAGRAAAEEVFGLVAKRVEGMGGVGAWREKEKQKREGGGSGGGWGWDVPRLERGGDEDDGDREDLDEREREAEEVAVKDGDEEEVILITDSFPLMLWNYFDLAIALLTLVQNFTMDMMLRSLNIDLDVIGYDKELQKWIG